MRDVMRHAVRGLRSVLPVAKEHRADLL